MFLLQLETINDCNARCPFCPLWKQEEKRGILSWDIINNICSNLEDKVEYLCFYLNGEPFLDKRIINIMKLFNSQWENTKLSISTNSSLMGEYEANALLKMNNLTEIRFSINANTVDEYKKIMGLDWSQSYRNIDYFMKKRQQLNRDDIKVFFSSVINRDFSLIEDFRKYENVMLYSTSDAFKDKRIQPIKDYYIVLANGKLVTSCMDSF